MDNNGRGFYTTSHYTPHSDVTCNTERGGPGDRVSGGWGPRVMGSGCRDGWLPLAMVGVVSRGRAEQQLLAVGLRQYIVCIVPTVCGTLV